MPYILNKYYPWRNLLFFLGEGLLIFLSLNLVYSYWEGFLPFASGEGAFYLLRALIVTLIFQLCLYYFDLYDLSRVPTIFESTVRLAQAFGFGCIALGVLYYLFPMFIISIPVFWTSFLAIFVSISLWRLVYFWVLQRRLFTQPIALVGTGSFAGKIARAIEAKQDSGYTVVAGVGERTGNVPLDATVFPRIADLRELCLDRAIEKIVLAPDERRGRLPMHELISYRFMGISIVDGVDFYETLTGKMPVEKVNPSWFLFSNGFSVSRITKALKRLLDILLSLVGLTLALPVMGLSALLVKLESPGPVFYRQMRVGKDGQPFRIIKFRSMRQDAEKDGAVWARENDSRVTRFGGIMRKLRIDEIPQMFNVLKGDMSFVGPRPERPVFVRDLAKKIPYYSIRHVVRPGITGWAQVYYPYGANEEDAKRKLEYDLFYIKNLSLTMDLFIIFQTVKIILFRTGAR